jgi:CDP-diacylglycerol--serine O-phosphatidyltransferase
MTPPTEDYLIDAPPQGAVDAPGTRRRAAGRRILQGIALTPALVTVLNGLLGFGAIHYATRDALGQTTPANLHLACWLVIGAMVCDMLDGRIARMARRTSDFGGQLDSLCDAISFAVAPAVILLRTVALLLATDLGEVGWLGGRTVSRALWCSAAVYVTCGVLRLARFNVENEPDESAHMTFEGLPTPGAAAALIATVLLWYELTVGQQLAGLRWLAAVTSLLLPMMAVGLGLLMVSRMHYPHLVNRYIRSRSRWSSLVIISIVAAFTFVAPYPTFALGAGAYALLGPVGRLRVRLQAARR